MPPITRGLCRARKIWIDDALCRAAWRRRVALRQRRVAAFVIVYPPAVHVQANRISRIVRLGRRRPYWDRPDRQNRQGQNAHQNLLRNMRGAVHRSCPNALALRPTFRPRPDFSSRAAAGECGMRHWSAVRSGRQIVLLSQMAIRWCPAYFPTIRLQWCATSEPTVLWPWCDGVPRPWCCPN